MNISPFRHLTGKIILPVALLGAVLVAQTPALTAAQDATPMPTVSTGTISVTGVGQVIITPDTANVQIGVQVFNEKLSVAQTAATEQITAVIKVITDSGIDKKDVQTSNYSVSIRQNYDNQGVPTEVLGYDIYNTLSVTVRDLDSLGTLLDQVVSAGANQIYGISFYASDLTDATAAARVAAVKDANERAKQLAAAAGVEVGAIVNITEGFSQSVSPLDYSKGYAGEMAMGDSAVPIQTGSQSVQITVSITYAIAQ
ncbi:MAG TPA: SIMPL domain-containing protein [Thermomicrobiales bacterium]|nr:SIMPL domain-containing protein [Thermomicrobiales bacterium]